MYTNKQNNKALLKLICIVCHSGITNLLEGELEMNIAGSTSILTPGKVAVIPGNTLHSAVALTDCKAIDVFFPVREDYKAL